MQPLVCLHVTVSIRVVIYTYVNDIQEVVQHSTFKQYYSPV